MSACTYAYVHNTVMTKCVKSYLIAGYPICSICLPHAEWLIVLSVLLAATPAAVAVEFVSLLALN